MKAEDRVELLSAFLDGEEIPPGELARALAAPEAREFLRDFASIRAQVLADEERPSANFYERMDVALATASPSGRRDRIRTVTRRSLVAAAILVAALLGAVVGREFITGKPTDAPPAYERRVDFVPGVDWEDSP
jgi:hypothetical protein